jgi:hypothetical protein
MLAVGPLRRPLTRLKKLRMREAYSLDPVRSEMSSTIKVRTYFVRHFYISSHGFSFPV